MKILVAGNLANMGFEIVKALRGKNIEANLLMPKYSHQTSDPKFMYPELKDIGYPKWVIIYDNKHGSGLNNWKLQIIREMRNNYDAIIALTEFSIFAMISGKPYGMLSTGSDMRELSFEKSLKGFLYRLSYKFARIVIWGEPDKINLIKKLGIEKKAVFCTNPRNFNFKIQKIEREKIISEKIIIFHPTSQYWRLKGNDKFLKAFVKICSENNDIYLIISERGPDLDRAKEILNKDITRNKYRFVPTLDSIQMQYYYNMSDIVVDQFNIGSMGMTAFEAMKFGKPIMLYLDKENFKKCYKNYPEKIINVNSYEEILNELRRIIKSPMICKEIGEENKKWVDENWDSSKLTERYIKICNAIMTNNIDVIKSPSRL